LLVVPVKLTCTALFEVISQAVVLKVPDAVPVELDGVATAIVCG